MSMFEIHGGFTGLAASSRVRLARNIKGYPFRLTEQQHSEIADKVFAALKENPTIGPEFDKKQIIPVRLKPLSWSRNTSSPPSWRRTAAG